MITYVDQYHLERGFEEPDGKWQDYYCDARRVRTTGSKAKALRTLLNKVVLGKPAVWMYGKGVRFISKSVAQPMYLNLFKKWFVKYKNQN